MVDPKTGFLTELNPRKHHKSVTVGGKICTKKRNWSETNKQEVLNFYQQYMQERPKRQPKPVGIPKHLGKDVKIGRSGFRTAVKRKISEDAIYLEMFDSEDETDEEEYAPIESKNIEKTAELDKSTECDPNVKTNGSVEEGQYSTYRLFTSGTSKTVTNKLYLDNLRHNTLKMLEHSNICLFKWKKQYYSCYYCVKIFEDIPSLRCHTMNNHRFNQIAKKIPKDRFLYADISIMECTLCRLVLKNLNELENHLISHGILLKDHGSLLVPYNLCSDNFICQMCDDRFTDKYQLRQHMSKHFLNFLCNECNIGFKNNKLLKQHHLKVHGRKRYQIFSTYSPLKSDEGKVDSCASKSDYDRFKCNHCSKRFRYDYKKLQHLIDEHSEESKLFQCEFCSKIFLTVHWLTKHMSSVHREQWYN